MPPVMKQNKNMKSFYATLIKPIFSLRTGIRPFILVRLSCLPLITAIFIFLKVSSSIVHCRVQSDTKFTVHMHSSNSRVRVRKQMDCYQIYRLLQLCTFFTYTTGTKLGICTSTYICSRIPSCICGKWYLIKHIK
jgi:hypothetical protein